jgi:hypothetical protein
VSELKSVRNILVIKLIRNSCDPGAVRDIYRLIKKYGIIFLLPTPIPRQSIPGSAFLTELV